MNDTIGHGLVSEKEAAVTGGVASPPPPTIPYNNAYRPKRSNTMTPFSFTKWSKKNMYLFVIFAFMIVVEIVVLMQTYIWATPESIGISHVGHSLALWNTLSTATIQNSSNHDMKKEANIVRALQDCYIRSKIVVNTTDTNSTIDTGTISTCPWEFCRIHKPNDDNVHKWLYHRNRDTMIRRLCDYQPTNTKYQNVQYQFYNPLPTTTRYICRRRIAVPGNTTVTVSAQDCSPHHHIRSNMFQVPPIELSTTNAQIHILAKHQIPIELRFSIGGYKPPLSLFDGCDIPCKSDGLGGLVVDRYVVSTPDLNPWTLTFSMEGPEYYHNLQIDPMQYRNNHFWSTTSFRSEIPLPYYSRAEYKIYHNDYVPYDRGIKGAMFMANNCNSMNTREKIVEDMIKYVNGLGDKVGFRVDSLSSCLYNADPPNGVGKDNKILVMKQYLFYLAFENQCVDDYITEKLWGPFEAGTIPVYYGSHNIKQHVPNNSIIHVDDYSTTQELVEHLIDVSKNRTLYESYHAWRTQPEPEHFRIKYDITDTHSTCRTCRWAYARIHGLGWNHTTQSLRPLNRIGSRQVCLSTVAASSSSVGSRTSLLVNHPFIEEWTRTNGDAVLIDPVDVLNVEFEKSDTSTTTAVDKECPDPLTNANHAVDIENGKLRRYAYNYDGVTDFIIFRNGKESSGVLATDAVLRLTMPILTDPIEFRKVRDDVSVWHLQDAVTRYTIMASTTTASQTNPYEVEYNNNNIAAKNGVSIRFNEENRVASKEELPTEFRIRILVEDIDTFHLNATEVESYYGQLLTNDFLHPVEMYVSVPPAERTK